MVLSRRWLLSVPILAGLAACSLPKRSYKVPEVPALPGDGVALLLSNVAGGYNDDGWGFGVAVVLDGSGSIVASVRHRPTSGGALLATDGSVTWLAGDGVWAWAESLTRETGPDGDGSLISLAGGDTVVAVRNVGLVDTKAYECGVMVRGRDGAVQRWRHPAWLGRGAVAVGDEVYGFSSPGLSPSFSLVRMSAAVPGGEELVHGLDGDFIWDRLVPVGDAELVTLYANSYSGQTATLWRFDTVTGRVVQTPVKGLDVADWFGAGGGPAQLVVKGDDLLFTMARALWAASLSDGGARRLFTFEPERQHHLSDTGLLSTWKDGDRFNLDLIDWTTGRSEQRFEGIDLGGPSDLQMDAATRFAH